MTHKLQRSWTLWFDPGVRGHRKTLEDYGRSMLTVYEFDDLQGFWSVFNHIRCPSQLSDKATYYLFETGIEPKWEDPKNMQAGSWSVSLPKSIVDQCWEDVVLAVIGEQFAAGDHVHGVSMNVRRTDRIELWTGNADDEALQIGAGQDFQRALGPMGDRAKLTYDVFADKMSNARARSRYTM